MKPQLCALAQILLYLPVAAVIAGAQTDSSTVSPQQPVPPDDKRGVMGVEPDPTSHVQLLSFELNYVYRPNGLDQLQPLTAGSVLRSGDHYKIQFTPEEDSYVYLYQEDSSGALFSLFPMESYDGLRINNLNPVKAGVPYTLPAGDKLFKLDDQIGVETFYFLALREADEGLEESSQVLNQARQQQNLQRIKEIQMRLRREFGSRRLVKIVPDPSTRTRIAWIDKEAFTLFTHRVEGLCERCISVLRFEHRRAHTLAVRGRATVHPFNSHRTHPVNSLTMPRSQ